MDNGVTEETLKMEWDHMQVFCASGVENVLSYKANLVDNIHFTKYGWFNNELNETGSSCIQNFVGQLKSFTMRGGDFDLYRGKPWAG